MLWWPPVLRPRAFKRSMRWVFSATKRSDERSPFTMVLDLLTLCCLFLGGYIIDLPPCKGGSEEPDDGRHVPDCAAPSRKALVTDALWKNPSGGHPWRAGNAASRNQALLSRKRLLPSISLPKNRGEEWKKKNK